MDKLHSLLNRQLNKFINNRTLSKENIDNFVSAVNEAYFQFDEDRNMLERSLEISSEELLNANQELRNREQIILRHNEALRTLSIAIEQSPNSIIIMDKNGIIQYVNPKFIQRTGLNTNDVVNKSLFDLQLSEISISEYEKVFNEIYNRGEWKEEVKLKVTDNFSNWVSVSVTAIKNELNEITHFLLIAENITEKKLNEYQLILAKEKAERADKIKSDFLAQISHEIRTPLNIILNYNSLIKQEVEYLIEGDLKESFNSIERASQRLIRTIDLILNMSEIQSNNFKPTLLLLDLFDIIKIQVTDFQTLAKMKNLELKCNCIAKNTKLMVDEFSINQVFMNLIDNAIKYTQQGSIEVILYEIDPDSICIDIKDTGIGISEEFFPNLFSPFSQEDAGYTRSFEGNGLGLALVKKYVELNNGQIKVKSTKGEGTVFTLIFNR
jgi:PAS domain S-box-containing protein